MLTNRLLLFLGFFGRLGDWQVRGRQAGVVVDSVQRASFFRGNDVDDASQKWPTTSS